MTCFLQLQELQPLLRVCCVNSSLLYSMDLHWSLGSEAGDGSTGDGITLRGGQSGGGGDSSGGVSGCGDVCLWVAAGTVFLDVLTWSFPSLTTAMLRASAASGTKWWNADLP